MKRIISLAQLVLLSAFIQINISAQDKPLVQSIKGVVVDVASGAPLPFATIMLSNIPMMGTTTNNDGIFVLENVPVGRHNLQVSSVGYETNIVREIMLTSAKEIYLEIGLKENVHALEEVVVKPRINKEESLNKMALSGARMLSVEEASRYAGGMDDPARLVGSFAGVSSGVASNGISIHGNAPGLLQWRLEDVEIPNPNHFADVASLGGGILSSLSNNVLGNSDFFTSAFPAEYNNAVSGVFDMKLRNGNNQKFQQTFQAGLLGLDFASEGPLSREHHSSYIFNYRYSTTGLLNKIGNMGQALDFQDLNFKLNFPTKNAGIFSVWGSGLRDEVKPDIESPEEWKYKDDAKGSGMKQTSASAGISHRFFFGNNALLKTTVATTFSETDASEDLYDFDLMATPYLDFKSKYTNLILTSYFNRKYSAKHTNRTGFTVTNMNYDMTTKLAPFDTEPLATIGDGKGNTNLVSAYSSSLFNFNSRVSATLGVNWQLLTLNNSWTMEPRASIKWQATSKSSFGLAYGLHSRMEKMDVYFVKINNELVNTDLDFTKTDHFSFSYNFKISDDMNLRLEPYYQHLFDVPVIADSSYSILNRRMFYIEDALVNKGKGRNYGLDITFEKYMTKGLYYMITASVFSSEYQGGNGIWYNTRFNRNYIVNGLLGKEWMLGKNGQNVLGVNFKLSLQGGDRYSPVDEQATMAHPDRQTQYDESKAFSEQLSPMFLANYTFSYKMNRKRVSHEIALKGLNATGYKEYFGHEYNFKTGAIEPRRLENSLFNITYRIDF